MKISLFVWLNINLTHRRSWKPDHNLLLSTCLFSVRNTIVLHLGITRAPLFAMSWVFEATNFNTDVKAWGCYSFAKTVECGLTKKISIPFVSCNLRLLCGDWKGVVYHPVNLWFCKLTQISLQKVRYETLAWSCEEILIQHTSFKSHIPFFWKNSVIIRAAITARRLWLTISLLRLQS